MRRVIELTDDQDVKHIIYESLCYNHLHKSEVIEESNWRMIHESFLTNELASLNKFFDENTKVVCEEFEVVYS